MVMSDIADLVQALHDAGVNQRMVDEVLCVVRWTDGPWIVRISHGMVEVQRA